MRPLSQAHRTPNARHLASAAFHRGGHRLAAASFLVASVALASAQTIFSATERADPGQSVTVNGSGFSSAPSLALRRYNSDGSLGAATTALPASQNELGAIVTMPASNAFGIYRISTGSGSSVLVNAPRVQWADTPSAMAGGTVRLIGRNLHPTTSATTVRLVDSTTGASLTAAVSASSDASVSFTVPSGVVTGRSYRVLLNSGIAGSVSETAAPETLGIVAKAADPFGLATYWAGDFVPIAAKTYNLKTDPRLPKRASGNGKADDTAALQGAIDYAAKTGGGTVYVPTGTYRVDNGNSIVLRSRVVLKGDGMGKTIFQVGYRYTAGVTPPSYGWAFNYQNASTSGLTELTIRNLNASPTPNGVFRGSDPTSTTNRSFYKNVAFEINNGTTPNMVRPREAVIQGCRFTVTSLWSPIDVSGARYLRFAGNTLDYRGSRVNMVMNYRTVIEGNTVRIDNAYHTEDGVETGGIETSYAQQTLVSNNTIQGYGPYPAKDGDGEMVLAQRSNVPDFWDAGAVVSASGLKLYPASRNWPAAWLSPTYDDLARSYVSIVRGKGAGQWRRVAGHDAGSLTVDRAWDVAPDSTSTYSVGSLIALQQTWVGNTIQNGLCGLSLWTGGIDCLVANNRLTNTGAIIVRSATETAPTSDGTFSHQVAWNISVRDNTLTSTDPRWISCVSVSNIKEHGSNAPEGNLVLGVDLANNSVTGSQGTGRWEISRYDGYEVLGIDQNGIGMDPLSNWGTVLWNNAVTNSLLGVNIADVSSASVNGVLDAATTGTLNTQSLLPPSKK